MMATSSSDDEEEVEINSHRAASLTAVTGGGEALEFLLVRGVKEYKDPLKNLGDTANGNRQRILTLDFARVVKR
jgi:hypothetical protein